MNIVCLPFADTCTSYGFVSENAAFADKLQDAGIKFIGPPSSAITAMGSKSRSKAIMDEAGVPCTPGFFGDDNQDADFLLGKAVSEVGFPLLIKAVMGGGGKGMRLVWNELEFKEALASCQRESQSAFGDSAVLLEKYLVNPRHVEVQVVADEFGDAVFLWERDCSLQRRHQKIIEEAPASDLPLEMRQRLGQMGTKAAKATGYVNAGTVEVSGLYCSCMDWACAFEVVDLNPSNPTSCDICSSFWILKSQRISISVK